MMIFAAMKAALSGIIVALVSEIAKRNAALGAVVASLPIVSVLAMIWLWHETKDAERIAAHSQATFWYVLPSLPMFLLFPELLRGGIRFYPALLLSCGLTVMLYLGMVWMLKKFGISL